MNHIINITIKLICFFYIMFTGIWNLTILKFSIVKSTINIHVYNIYSIYVTFKNYRLITKQRTKLYFEQKNVLIQM